MHGLLHDQKCYTHPLILPEPGVTSDGTVINTIQDLLATDSSFAADCQKATIQNIFAYQEAEYSDLRDALSTTPVMFHALPFHQYIQASTPVCAICAATKRLLWHQRLGHPSDYYLYHAHKYVTGVPKFKHMDTILDTCPTCIRAKQTKESAGPHTTRTATRPFQGLSIDFSFSGTASSDSSRATDFVGLNGETSWILITDHFTRYKYGDTRISKASPLHWLHHFLKTYSPQCSDKYVYLDQGGELYQNPEVRRLFQRFGYQVRPTGADASNQNGPVERGHRSVANAIRALLTGANLPVKFWPYAFHHWLRIDNAIPSRDQSGSPVELAMGKRDDFTHFRTFGCRVWVRPPQRRRAKFVPNSRKGIFLGYIPNTTKNILWYDVETTRVKIARHARFDEGMNDLPLDALPPNVVHLQRLQSDQPFPAEDADVSVPQYSSRLNPFSYTISKDVDVQCTDPSFGFRLRVDEVNNRVFIDSILPRSTAARIHSSLKATNNKLRGAYIVGINGTPVFTLDDALHAFRSVRDDKSASFTLQYAPERRLSLQELRQTIQEHDLFNPGVPDVSPPASHAPTLTVADIRAIAALRHPDLDFSPDSLSSEQIATVISAIQSSAITLEEQALGRFTRRKLRKLSTWPDWEAGERKQLDHFHSLGMYGPPVPRPPNAVVLRPHWQYHVKRDGTRRSRNCCDGSPRAAPLLHRLASTYSSCVEQPVQRLFFALSAALGYRVYGGDAVDAYAHSPAPDVPTFVTIDDAFAEWYQHRFGVVLDRSYVLPVQHALQGHPEAGRLWETHINGILKSDPLSFRHTTHDRSIYSTVYKGVPVLLLRQVDDFALASPDETIAEEIYGIIGQRLQLPSETSPPFKYFGLISDFNGVDITQTSTTVEITCKSYLARVLRSHGWDTPCASKASPHRSHRSVPLAPEAHESMYQLTGPMEGTKEHAKLAAQHGFSFRTLLGELLYAYVCCRPDLGYSVVTLSKFSTCPHDSHYILLKKVAKYLRETIDFGVIYTKSTFHSDLPASTHPRVTVEDPTLPSFPLPSSLLELVGYVDAAHANDLRKRRSTTGYVFMLAGGPIAYRCTTQSITATSSTEAEFLAAVLAAKQVRYLRSILSELGFPQHSPTSLHEDNQSAIHMINSNTPTDRSRHIDIQHFAIQDWKANGDLLMAHIPGVINPADALTKPLGWVLHSRHVRRMMGHHHMFPVPTLTSVPTALQSTVSTGGGC